MVWAVVRRNCAACFWRFLGANAVGGAVGDAVSDAVGDAVGDVVGNAVGEIRTAIVEWSQCGHLRGVTARCVFGSLWTPMWLAVRSAMQSAMRLAMLSGMESARYARRSWCGRGVGSCEA